MTEGVDTLEEGAELTLLGYSKVSWSVGDRKVSVWEKVPTHSWGPAARLLLSARQSAGGINNMQTRASAGARRPVHFDETPVNRFETPRVMLAKVSTIRNRRRQKLRRYKQASQSRYYSLF